jgi:hypothetical protein
MLGRLGDLILGIFGTRALRRARWSWLGYGLLAYAGLRLMRRFGIFPEQTSRLINTIDRGADVVLRRRPDFTKEPNRPEPFATT